MRKTIFALLLAGLVLTTAGCGTREESKVESPGVPESASSTVTTEPESPTVPVDESVVKGMADQIKEQVSMVDGMTPIASERNAENAFPGISELAEEFAVYVNGTGGYAEEIAVIKAKEGVTTQQLEELMETRVEFQKATFENYQPREMAKLETPVILSNNGITVLVIADDNAVAETAVKAALGL